MYELTEHNPVVAEQLAQLPRRAVPDYDAVIHYILSYPWDADPFSTRFAGGPGARMRRFGLDRGYIVYTPDGDTRTVDLDRIDFPPTKPAPPAGTG